MHRPDLDVVGLRLAAGSWPERCRPPNAESLEVRVTTSTVIWAKVDMVVATRNPGEASALATALPAGTILFYLNAHRYIFDEQVAQGVWNLRDYFKEDRRTLVLLAPELRLPPELQQDILILDEQLPSDARLQQIILEQYDVAGLPAPSNAFLMKAIDAVRGLAPFSAEQVVAMSLTNKGLNLDQLWSRKRQTIELTRGLTVECGGETIADIGGSETQTGNMERDATRVAQACARGDERRWQALLIVVVRRWSCRAASQPDHRY
jgi:hypothetical protein